MADFLQNLVFNQISFLIGFIAGALGLWLLLKLRPAIPGWVQKIRSNSSTSRVRLVSNNAARLQQDLLRHVQGLHLAAPLFALDEILVKPGLLLPPPPIEPGSEQTPQDVLSTILPYLPDWPELAARYSARTVSLTAALEVVDHLTLTGEPGSGKTVAMAHLIVEMARVGKSSPHLQGRLPVYTHIADLLPDQRFDQSPLTFLHAAVCRYTTSLSSKKTETLLKNSLHQGKILLLLDGLDEAPPSLHKVAIQFLRSLMREYPGTRLVVAARPDYYPGLIELGCVPLPISAWGEGQHLEFINKWSRSWYRHIRPLLAENPKQIDPRLLNAWLLADNPINSPFDATLKAWAVFAGDALGPRYLDSIESYLWRMTNHLGDARSSLEDFALQLVASQQIAMDPKQARGISLEQVFDVQTGTDLDTQKSALKRSKGAARKLPGSAPALVENGLLVPRPEERLSFCHPLIMAYLAASALSEAPVSHFLAGQPEWTGKSLTLLFLAASRESSPEISEILSNSDDPLLRRLLSIGRWLHYAPATVQWRSGVMRALAGELQRASLPLGLRARLMSALLLSGDPGVGVLLRQISYTSIQDLQQLAVLGMGYLLDGQSLNRLNELLSEPEGIVSQAACFALAKIGNQQSLELLGAALLHGSDFLRRSAAEALALEPGEGHEMLKEASQMEDLLVRRAAVFGLARVQQDWSQALLSELALGDDEWVVKSAAAQILETEQAQGMTVPGLPPALHETPWLVAFAGDRGIGIAPGAPAENLLLSALVEGTPAQQQAALNALQFHPMKEALPQVFEFLEARFGGMQDAAYDTLAAYAAQGLEIKRPDLF